MRRHIMMGIFGVSCLLPIQAIAEDAALVTHKTLGLELATELAEAALESCRDADFQVAVAVVDRFGILQVLLRDRLAGPHTPDTARRKAWTAVSFRTDTQSSGRGDGIGLAASGRPRHHRCLDAGRRRAGRSRGLDRRRRGRVRSTRRR